MEKANSNTLFFPIFRTKVPHLAIFVVLLYKNSYKTVEMY